MEVGSYNHEEHHGAVFGYDKSHTKVSPTMSVFGSSPKVSPTSRHRGIGWNSTGSFKSILENRFSFCFLNVALNIFHLARTNSFCFFVSLRFCLLFSCHFSLVWCLAFAEV